MNTRAARRAREGGVDLVLRIDRRWLTSILGAIACRPTTVSERSCARVIGIPRREFLKGCDAGAFPFRLEGTSRVALTTDVERYWTRGLFGEPKPSALCQQVKTKAWWDADNRGPSTVVPSDLDRARASRALRGEE